MRCLAHIPTVHKTFYEVDRFTVLSLDLQPDVDLSGSVDAGDAAAQAAEWDRKWLIPAGTNVWQTAVGASFPQTLELTLPHLGAASGVSRVELELSGVSQLEGWCVNGRFASGSQTGDDFSFAPTYDLRAITVLPEVQYSHENARQLLASHAHLQLFCKDTGGRCVLTATPYDGDDNAMTPVTVAIPLDGNGNGIADAWEKDKVTQHNSVCPSAPVTWSPALYAAPLGDDEPAALGSRRTDGTYSHADTGDGLSVLDEYRGYVLDGGAGFTGARHVRLSPSLKELLVQVAEQDDYLSDMGNGDVINPSAMQAYNLASSMQAVAQFYAHPQRGAGIDLYWVRTPFLYPRKRFEKEYQRFEKLQEGRMTIAGVVNRN